MSWPLLGVVGVFVLGGILLAALGGGGNAGGPAIGAPAPDFSLQAAGGAVTQADLQGGVYMLNFFASWCKPCATEAGDLEAIWQEFQGRGVRFYGVTYQDSPSKVQAFVDEHGLTFPIAEDRGQAARAFGVTGVPETYVIDAAGNLVYKRLGPIDPTALRSALEDSLK